MNLVTELLPIALRRDQRGGCERNSSGPVFHAARLLRTITASLGVPSQPSNQQPASLGVL